MRKIFNIESKSGHFHPDGGELAKSLSSQIRGNCTKVSGPHRLANAWDINCTFGSTEVWLMLRRDEKGYTLVLDTVWDLPTLLLRKGNRDLAQFENDLRRWIEQHASFTNRPMHPAC